MTRRDLFRFIAAGFAGGVTATLAEKAVAPVCAGYESTLVPGTSVSGVRGVR